MAARTLTRSQVACGLAPPMLRSLVVLTLLASLGANAWFIQQAPKSSATSVVSQSSTPPGAALPPTSASQPEPSLQSGPKTQADYGALRTRLEREGLPPHVARMVLAALVQHDFTRRIAELQPVGNYWSSRRVSPTAETDAAMRRLREEMKSLQRALGVSRALDEPWGPLAERESFGNLAPEKKTRIERILADYSEMRDSLAEGALSPSERSERGKLLAQEMRADLAQTLTPQEMREYDYRTSQAGNRLRNRFREFEATEAEFLTLYPQVKALLETAATTPKGTPANQLGTLDRQIETAVHQALGEARYQELKAANDHAHQRARRFLAAAKLPVALAGEVASIEHEYSKKYADVWNNGDLSRNQAVQQANALELEKQEKLGKVLGSQVKAYSQFRESNTVFVCGGG